MDKNFEQVPIEVNLSPNESKGHISLKAPHFMVFVIGEGDWSEAKKRDRKAYIEKWDLKRGPLHPITEADIHDVPFFKQERSN